MLPVNLITAARCSTCVLEEDLFSCDALKLQLEQFFLTMDGAVVLIFSSSPFPIMRLPARKGMQKNNFWLDHCYLLLEKKKVKLYYSKIQVVEQTKIAKELRFLSIFSWIHQDLT